MYKVFIQVCKIYWGVHLGFVCKLYLKSLLTLLNKQKTIIDLKNNNLIQCENLIWILI